MLHLVSLSVLSAANAQLVECQTLDQWILCKTFHSVHVTTIQCLGYTLNFNMLKCIISLLFQYVSISYLIKCYNLEISSIQKLDNKRLKLHFLSMV